MFTGCPADNRGSISSYVWESPTGRRIRNTYSVSISMFMLCL